MKTQTEMFVCIRHFQKVKHYRARRQWERRVNAVHRDAVRTLWQRCGGLLERHGRVVGAPRARCKDAV